MRLFRHLIAVVTVITVSSSTSVVAQGTDVRSNEGNCVGVHSCRPRCVTFRLDRQDLHCGLSEGIFLLEGDVNPWDVKRFTTSTTCDNDTLDLSGDLTVRIGEEGHSGDYFYTTVDLLASGNDRFTFCSVYPCTKEECSLPEQMGFGLQFSIFNTDVVVDDFSATPLLMMKLYLKAAFVGSPLQDNVTNRYGPLHVEWMDDPAGCRVNQFSNLTLTAPPVDPEVYTDSPAFDPALYCDGDEYLPAELPMVAPTASPSQSPSQTPTRSLSPSSSPSYTEVGENQLQGLQRFFDSTNMDSAQALKLHNWFTTPDYCRFTGVTCDASGYVKIIDLTGMKLTGELPSNLAPSLTRLHQIKLVNNQIEGSIPEDFSDLDQLTQLELGSNELTGTIPESLHKLQHLRRLMLQFNDLDGTIPHHFCQLYMLNAFDLSGNRDIYGEIPQCLGDLPLEVLRVDDVGLVGQVPPQLCTRSKMNGIYPNWYGCDAIACPAGSFEPSTGRTFNNHTGCVDCDIVSNVIGSKSCLLVENNTILTETTAPSVVGTFSPPNSPSMAPSRSLIPTSADNSTSAPSTQAPSLSLSPSLVPSLMPTLVLSSMPTLLPSTLPSPTPPSSQPSARIESVSVTVVLASVPELLTEEEVRTLENATALYLEESSGSSEMMAIEISNVTVVSQVLGDATSLLTRIHDNNDRRRHLAEALVLDMEVEGWLSNISSGSTPSFSGMLQESLVANYSTYVKALKDALPSDALAPLPTFAPTMAQVLEESVPEDNKKRATTNWWLLGLMFGMAVIALIAVFLAVGSRKKRRAQERRYAAAASETSLAPSKPPAVQKALSDESSTGWHSESSPSGGDEFVSDSEVQEWSWSQKKKSTMAVV